MKRANGLGFQSLLQAIEAEDTEGRIEIHIYLTAKIEWVYLYFHGLAELLFQNELISSEDKMNNILVNDVGAETDAITFLRSPTHFGRPNVCTFPAFLRSSRSKALMSFDSTWLHR